MEVLNLKPRQPRNGYACIGSVRGWCGHIHKKFEAAVKCKEKDGKLCNKLGGYSDRTVMKVYHGMVQEYVPYITSPHNGEPLRVNKSC